MPPGMLFLSAISSSGQNAAQVRMASLAPTALMAAVMAAVMMPGCLPLLPCAQLNELGPSAISQPEARTEIG